MELFFKLNHYGFGYKDKRFLCHPVPYNNELLSSWIVRISVAHRTNPVTFMHMHFPKMNPEFWSRDVDLYWGEQLEFLEKLSYKSRVPVERLKQMTLLSYESYLLEKIHVDTRNKFILHLVNRGRDSHHKGLRFCPLCLVEEEEPYYKKEWRLSFSTACLKHKCFLHDCCPKCKKPLTIFKLGEYDDIAQCHHCSFDLKKAKPEIISLDSYGLKAIKKLYRILDNGFFKFSAKEEHSLGYFSVVNQLTKLIYNFQLQKKVFKHENMRVIVDLPKFKRKPSIYLENASIKEQYLVFSSVVYTLDSKERFFKFCNTNHVKRSKLYHSVLCSPFWYTKLVDEVDGTCYSIASGEIESAIKYLDKQGLHVNLRRLSLLCGTSLDKRHRPDIVNLLKIRKTNKKRNGA